MHLKSSLVPNCRGRFNYNFGQISPPISLYQVPLNLKFDLKMSHLFQEFRQILPTHPYNQARESKTLTKATMSRSKL